MASPKNYCPRCGAFRVGKIAMDQHLETGHDPSEGYSDGFAPGAYTPGSATEEFGGPGNGFGGVLLRSTGVWGDDD